MAALETHPHRLLLIDTCSANGGVALAAHGAVVATGALPERSASASLLTAVQNLLAQTGWQATQLTAIGVVNGPGSFTGVRVGLAAAKGLCEALQVPLAAVSRLDVLAHTAVITDGLAVLDAGRGELYVRDITPQRAEESLMRIEDLLHNAQGRAVVLAEEKLLDRLASLHPRMHALSVTDALQPVLAALNAGGSDVAITDANYVRSEAQIYAKSGVKTA